MGIALFDPQVHNIETLAEVETLDTVEKEFVADPFAHFLLPRCSFLGRVITWIYAICELFGWLYSYAVLQTALKSSRIALEHLNTCLMNGFSEGSPQASTLISLSFDELWQKRFRHVEHLFQIDSDFPTFEKAQRVVAPQLVEGITKTKIPWDLFQPLLHQEEIGVPSQQRLHEWIEDVQTWGTFVSPYLLLSVCEEAANRSFPNALPGEQASHAFFLAWTLFKAGLSSLASPELDPAEGGDGVASSQEKEGDISLGTKIPLVFPLDFPLSAYCLSEYPHLMALRSTAPLIIGMWLHNLNECASPVQCVKSISCDYRGTYAVVERLSSSLLGDIWEATGISTPHDADIFQSVVSLFQTLVELHSTLDIELDHLFLTSLGGIRAIAPFQIRHPFFCLPVVEMLARQVCHEDEERLRLLFNSIGIWHHPSARVYRSLIENFGFTPTDSDIHRELQVYDIDDGYFPYIVEWARHLRFHANRIRDQLKGSSEFSSITKKQLSSLFLALQNEMGCISYIPPDLSDRIMQKLHSGSPLEHLTSFITG